MCAGLLWVSAIVLRYDVQLWRRPPGGSGSHAVAVVVLVLAVGLFLTAAGALGLLIFLTALRSTRLRRWARRPPH